MLLTIDAGNTLTSFVAWDGEEAAASWSVTSQAERSDHELRSVVAALMGDAEVTAGEVDGAIIGSVVPRLTPALEAACRALFPAIEPVVVGPGVRTGVALRVENPKEVGADRIANVLAATRTYGAPVVVVDLGTATVLDVAGPDGAYAGAVILPGVDLGLEALVNGAARLTWVDVAPPAAVVGRTTAAAMQSGAVFGAAALVDGLVRMIREETGTDGAVIATGARASVLEGISTTVDHYDPLLTARGLRLIHELNRPV